ncbi:hypothetical protein B0J12DRAFT_731989 [Macrophomina phaseolina]|uniref:Uncharacterized protein n=1 Tax=Macrophomina phaseolina TaxID=35725 RepID=A0ABQ8FXG4_9PEZI|nr:hypothetical protein B0J12DRAFT_731989 [Macrophomina phaseolina]
MDQIYNLPAPPPPIHTRLSSPIIPQFVDTVTQQEPQQRSRSTIKRRGRLNIPANGTPASGNTEKASKDLDAATDFTSYFLERQRTRHADFCIFLCWQKSSQSVIRATDVPICEDISAIGTPDQEGFMALLDFPENFQSRANRILNQLLDMSNTLDSQEIPCRPFDLNEETGKFRYDHSCDCPAEITGFMPCPYEERERMRGELHDLQTVPRLLEATFRDPGLATGQNLLMRDVTGWEVTRPYIYHYLQMPKIYKGQHLSELRFRAFFIKEKRRKFRSICWINHVFQGLLIITPHRLATITRIRGGRVTNPLPLHANPTLYY